MPSQKRFYIQFIRDALVPYLIGYNVSYFSALLSRLLQLLLYPVKLLHFLQLFLSVFVPSLTNLLFCSFSTFYNPVFYILDFTYLSDTAACYMKVHPVWTPWSLFRLQFQLYFSFTKRTLQRLRSYQIESIRLSWNRQRSRLP